MCIFLKSCREGLHTLRMFWWKIKENINSFEKKKSGNNLLFEMKNIVCLLLNLFFIQNVACKQAVEWRYVFVLLKERYFYSVIQKRRDMHDIKIFKYEINNIILRRGKTTNHYFYIERRLQTNIRKRYEQFQIFLKWKC